MFDRAEHDRLDAIARAEHVKFTELAVVASAESVVRISRVEELAAAQRTAWRRVTAARGQLTRARKDGSADRIAVAARRLDDRQREAEQLADTGIAEMQHLIGGGLDNNGAMLTQIRRTWDAQHAVLDNLRDRPAAGT